MSALAPIAFLTLAAACTNPFVAPDLLQKVATTESGLDPLTIHDNATGAALHPATVEEAAKAAEQLQAAGHDFDAGLMQINVRNWRWLGLNATSAFDGCASIGAAADLFVSISKYNTGNATGGFVNGYVRKVLAAGHGVSVGAPSALPPVSSAPAAAPAAAPEAPKPPAFQAAGPWDLYGRARSGDPAFKPFATTRMEHH